MLELRRAGRRGYEGVAGLERRRRIAAYGICRDDDGRVLLTRGSLRAALPGLWQLPGGGIEHGEHPAHAVVREFVEETGLAVEVAGLRDVLADVLALPERGVQEHTDRIIYDVTVTRAGVTRHETDGTTDRAEWIAPDRLAELPMMSFTAELLGLPVRPGPPAAASPVRPAPPGPERPTRGQRFAAYGLATDPAGRVLLTRIAPGYPGAGRWHLPGGGTDHGEQPATALLRELAEESNQVGRITGLLDISHHRNPAAVGPEGYPMDWHAVRATYRLIVDAPTEPRVTEAAGGSTERAGWFTAIELSGLRLTDVAVRALAHLGR
ncbi:ADP-ribose pyrophosphatase YjhB, NUDIX family [Micromonospora pattaloongensis]|uniref:ADP-ribose pyrophosphatase YjhB, NUDIX family n=1 Tax=Micromonospora pattaloongensis TaxID=405436 RepID=A0A1H3MGC1_9ACTN|nr:NUDIX domain-containing protein [Micromonospora pattaloongensis]SDY75209.1 ADP-ribose pyrophosphatase YjhB, NUDIX family [Micromonospora pattaloongensis]